MENERDGNIKDSQLVFDKAHAESIKAQGTTATTTSIGGVGEGTVTYSEEDLRRIKPLIDIQRALIIYFSVVLIISITMYSGVKLKWWSAFVFALIIGQIVLNVVYLPVYVDFWSEFNSYIALYSFLQLLTPLIVFVYALTMAITDRR